VSFSEACEQLTDILSFCDNTDELPAYMALMIPPYFKSILKGGSDPVCAPASTNATPCAHADCLRSLEAPPDIETGHRVPPCPFDQSPNSVHAALSAALLMAQVQAYMRSTGAGRLRMAADRNADSAAPGC